MATAAIFIPLEDELEAILQAIAPKKRFNCHGKKRVREKITDEPCSYPLGPSSKANLAALIRNIIELLQTAGGGVEKSLKKASFLICCRYHQDQAPDKFKAWLTSYSLWKLDKALHSEQESQPPGPGLPASSAESLEKVAPLEPIPQIPGNQKAANLHPGIYREPSSLAEEDPGYQSDDERNGMGNDPPASAASLPAKSGISLTSNGIETPKTPKRPPPMPATDSGYMSFGTPTKVAAKREECPPSPLEGKAGTRSSRALKTSEAPPEPIQPPEFKPDEKFSVPDRQPREVPVSTRSSEWECWDDPYKGMKKYIMKDLSVEALKDGYIYGFMIDGCVFTKIGFAAQRKNKKSLLDSLNHRLMNEHKKCGWTKLKQVVTPCHVPHARKVEKIIHYHLEADRKREVNMCKESDGQQCKHEKHTEWFDTPLPRINEVMRAWKRWIEAKPYIKVGKEMCLSPEWQRNLDTVPNPKAGEDALIVWLQWIDYYVPGPVMPTREIDWKGNHVTPNGATKVEENPGKTAVLNGTRAPKTRNEFKMLSTRTWPASLREDSL